MVWFFWMIVIKIDEFMHIRTISSYNSILANMEKSELYKLIQLSEYNNYPVKITRPFFTYSDTYDKSTDTHKMVCHGTIQIDDTNFAFDSNVFNTKKAANQHSCAQMLKCIYRMTTSINTNSEPDTQSDYSIDSEPASDDRLLTKKLLILIDFENINSKSEMEKLHENLSHIKVIEVIDSEDELNTQEITKDIELIKFAGKASSVKTDANIIVKSTRKDAVDHYIGFYLGKRIGENPSMSKTHSIHILSRDHFASCLEDFCPNVVHNTDVDDFLESLKDLEFTL